MARISRTAHAAMLVAMVAMLWRGEAFAGWLQSGLFTAIALWFALRAVAASTDRPANAHHAVLAAGMSWMTATPAGHVHLTGGAGLALVAYCLVATAVWLAFAAARRSPGAVGHAGMAAAMGAMAWLG